MQYMTDIDLLGKAEVCGWKNWVSVQIKAKKAHPNDNLMARAIK